MVNNNSSISTEHKLQPKNKASLLKLGTIKKGTNKRYWKVIKEGKGGKQWISTTRRETLCQNFLRLSIKKNLIKYKKGGYRSSRQAIAVAYNLTKRKFPSCLLVTNVKKQRKLNDNSHSE